MIIKSLVNNQFVLLDRDSFHVKIQKSPTKDKHHSILTKITTKKFTEVSNPVAPKKPHLQNINHYPQI